MHAKQRNEAIRHVVAYVFTIAMVFLAVTPFIYVVLTALKTKEQIYDPSQIIPTHITFDNFRQVLFQSNFVRYFMNSIFITLVTTLICMILSVMAAYGLTRYRIVGAGKIKMAVLMTRMFPGILLCIPYYIIMKQLNLIDSYIGLIPMYCSFTLPFAIWGEELGDENHFALMRAYDRALSDEDGSTFVERDDVDWLDDFELTKDDLADGK